MTELFLLAILITAITRVVRKIVPGALPGLADLGLRTPLRARFFGPGTSLKAADIQQGWRVLEIGPGWGFLTHEAAREVGAEGELVGLDINLKMLKRCRKKVVDPQHTLHLVCGDGAHLPFPDDSFDCVLLVSVLGEVRHRPAMFGELRRCLKPGATAIVNEIILDPDYVFPWTIRRFGERAGLEVTDRRGSLICHTTALTKPAVTVAAVAAGVEVGATETENSLPVAAD